MKYFTCYRFLLFADTQFDSVAVGYMIEIFFKRHSLFENNDILLQATTHLDSFLVVLKMTRKTGT